MASDEDSSVELRTKLLDYKSLDRAMTEERSNIFHLVTRGRQLFQAVTCPVTEKLLTDFADTWVQFSNEVASQLKKLDSIVSLLDIFDNDASNIEAWLGSTQHKLQAISKLEEVDERNVYALRKKMDLLLVCIYMVT